MKRTGWVKLSTQTLTKTKYLLARWSIKVRNDQYKLFQQLLKPQSKDRVLDIGVSSEEELVDTNLFEKIYPYRNKITAITIENSAKIKQKYPEITVIKIKPGQKLPFKNKEFQIGVSWATIEHVGGAEDQAKFLSEINRVCKKVFITTPYRYCIYEPHTEVFLLHWLSRGMFSKILSLLNKPVWADEKNLRPLSRNDVLRLLPNQNYQVKKYQGWLCFRTHLLIYRVQ
ncbi:MAG: class I SAM-dependent methyltransferase [Patescibacteria group bacterium]|nr:class I SAM-dependent methyltransferase [Patescibacteria group bacterium]